jgi:hypothetical protein
MAVSYQELTTLSLTALVSPSPSHIATDGKSVSKSSCQAPSGAHDQILIITVWQLRSCFCRAPSLTRVQVCLLYMLMALVSAVFLGTCDHILLSQIWDFPFCRLLRLAGSWWRYSAPPPHRVLGNFIIQPQHRPHRKQSFYGWGLFTEPSHSSGRSMDPLKNSLFIVA